MQKVDNQVFYTTAPPLPFLIFKIGYTVIPRKTEFS